MQLKILQLNIWAGMHLPQIKQFLATHDYDILAFQEVTGAHMRNVNTHSDIDIYQELHTFLSTSYEGELAIASHYSSDPVHGYQGNAIFYRKDITFLGKNTLTLSRGTEPFPSDRNTFEDVGRNALHLTLSKEGKVFDILNTHLPWAPTPEEQPHQTEQNTKLISYIASLQHPFILTGDFNLTPDQPTIIKLEKYASNLIKQHNVTNTLDKKNHTLFGEIPEGLAVDYVFVSPQMKVREFSVIDEDLSDHLGLTVTVDI